VNNDSSTYSSKTFLYIGNQFIEKYKSKIDSTNFSWVDSFKDNILIQREYPKYHGEFRRIYKFEYYGNGEPKRTTIQTFHPSGETLDSTIYKRTNSNTTEIINFMTGENPYIEVRNIINDTIFTDHIINGEYGFTTREFWESETRKHDQIIKPELSKVLNVYVHNERKDLIRIERFESGKFVETTMSINYEYDKNDRMILKDTYYGDGINKTIGSKEITIYNK